MGDGKAISILLVDDLEEKRYITAHTLQRAGFNVIEGVSGTDCLRLAKAQPRPELIILDVKLPDLDGFEVCRLLKSDPATAPIPLLHLPACFVQSENKVFGLQCGADAYLAEPVSADELIATVAALLRVRRAEEALREANAQLVEADRRKDEFLAMLAHELRNPLAPVRYAVQIMNTAGLQDPRMQRQVEIINRQVSHMARLLDDLLDVSRISRGKISLRKERIDLRLIADQTIEVSRPALNMQGHRLEYVRCQEPVWVDGDATRLEQILDNLLSNAIKYTEPGGQIRVSVSAEPENGKTGGVAAVSVRDTGIGLTAEMLPHVFDLFAQADHSLERTQGGLGIGLTMVRSLVALHGGSVGACSEGPGRGSEFVVRLPLARPESAEAPRSCVPRDPDQIASAPATECRKILIVEDNRDSAYTLADLLELWGHTVRVTLDGTSAIETARAWLPDLMLLDIGLPGLSGFEVARRLRAEPELAGIVVAVLTGYGQEDARQQSLESGVDRHFTKPVDLDELANFIARHVPCGRGGFNHAD